MPSGVHSTARIRAAGEIEHAALAEVPITHYETPIAGAASGHPRYGTDTGGLQLGYAVSAGLGGGAEVGAHLATAAGELNGKLGLYDGDTVAVALAPRLATSWAGTSRAGDTLYHARAPLLITLEPSPYVSVTPRAGLGFARGRVVEPGHEESSRAFVSGPFAEIGFDVLVQAGPRFGLSFEGYALRSLVNVDGRQFAGGGVGIALVFGTRVGRRAR
ncbi:MAG: hypothetical protein JWP97_4352 [Labilithrix sp.]|nr:hypothetical protein [Labilithrix sp.]